MAWKRIAFAVRESSTRIGAGVLVAEREAARVALPFGARQRKPAPLGLQRSHSVAGAATSDMAGVATNLARMEDREVEGHEKSWLSFIRAPRALPWSHACRYQHRHVRRADGLVRTLEQRLPPKFKTRSS